MDLDSIYEVARGINKLADEGKIRYSDIDDLITIVVKVDAARHYGIDKELYRRTHEGSDEGFIHSDNPIDVTLFGVKFIIEIDVTNG